MKTRISLVLFLAICLNTLALAQGPQNSHWDGEKIKGARFMLHPAYIGVPFLNDSWAPGEINFTDGEKADSLNLRYSSYKDEVVYYNPANAAQIVIDKASLSGFSFLEKDGKRRIFRKQYYDGFIKGDRYFEILSSGKIDLLVYRKVSLNSTSTYKDDRGILRNMAYNTDYQFYFYSPEKGYTSVRPTHSGMISKFTKTQQKSIKKLLRKNRIRIIGEESFVQAWKAIEKEGYEVTF
jgi:hypothetical protein